uniref:Uncharacterized protein n=1 Tax=Caenorhabditis japonica TaxID=281687 RepID=A0A8R1DJN5_CAEJA
MNTLIVFALLAVSVLAYNESENNYLQELIDAGVPQDTAQGIVDVAVKHNEDGADPNKTGRTIFESIIQETDAYIKTRPEADQAAYNKFVESKKNEFEQPDDGNVEDAAAEVAEAANADAADE